MSNLENAVADLIIKATSAAEAAGRFAVEQLPDIAQQYVLYIAIYNGIWLFVGLFILFGGPFSGAWLFRKGDGYTGPDKTQGAWIGALFGCPMGLFFIVVNLKEFILAVWAPKILLIQWAAELVK